VLRGVAGPLVWGMYPGRPADLGRERERLQRELGKIAVEVEKIERKLGNADFVGKAPAAVVAENRTRLEELQARRDKLGQNLAALGDPS
jgi:valyl-tRNA synthetase